MAGWVEAGWRSESHHLRFESRRRRLHALPATDAPPHSKPLRRIVSRNGPPPWLPSATGRSSAAVVDDERYERRTGRCRLGDLSSEQQQQQHSVGCLNGAACLCLCVRTIDPMARKSLPSFELTTAVSPSTTSALFCCPLCRSFCALLPCSPPLPGLAGVSQERRCCSCVTMSGSRHHTERADAQPPFCSFANRSLTATPLHIRTAG